MAPHEQVEKCARLLSRKSTDDEKFAGLLLLPRVIDAHDADAWMLVFDAMDIRFVERLMRTGIKQANDVQRTGDQALLNIAVSVIDVLASHASIATNTRMLERIPTLCTVAAMEIDQVSADAISVLCKLLAHDAAIDRVLRNPSILIQVVDAASKCSDPHPIAQFLDYALNRGSHFVHTHKDTAVARGWAAVVASTAGAFDKSHTVLKFELLAAIANALEPITVEDAHYIDEQTLCLSLIQSVSSGCTFVFKQKTEATQYTDQALVLYSHLVRLWPHHVFVGLAMHNATHSVHQKEAELALRLACVEGQSAIDSMMIAPPDSHDSQADCMRIRRGWKLSVCAEIAAAWLEWVTQWLDDQPSESTSIDEASIYNMMNEVQKLASSVVGFMLDWKERTSEKLMLENGADLIVSSVRFLTLWLATDPKLHQAAMPILSMCTLWIVHSPQHGTTIAEYVRPCISFALETCGISEAQYAADLMTRELHHDRSQAEEFASPWVGTIEFDDLARAVYSIPSDEDMLRDRK
ncbi:hypothetical protein IW148_001947 [Coemansia sp. RSA 1199]|nr:hypothetical protein IW148_001947 [Coemansia sp. RSA 1199]